MLTYCSFYEICSLAICINIELFDQVNREQLNIWKTVGISKILILLLTEDDSALKVAQQIMFWGLVAYKPVAYEKSIFTYTKNKNSVSLGTDPPHQTTTQ